MSSVIENRSVDGGRATSSVQQMIRGCERRSTKGAFTYQSWGRRSFDDEEMQVSSELVANKKVDERETFCDGEYTRLKYQEDFRSSNIDKS